MRIANGTGALDSWELVLVGGDGERHVYTMDIYAKVETLPKLFIRLHLKTNQLN